MAFPIAETRDEIEREVRKRTRDYPHAVAGGRLREETAQRKLALMKDAADKLRFLERHAAGLRALAHFLLASGATPLPTDAERDALLAHPGVKALLEVWPEAEVRILGLDAPLPPDTNDNASAEEEREDA